MSGFSRTPRLILRLMHWPPQVAYAVGLGPVIGRIVLLLTTTGRKSGKRHVTPLQYEEINGLFYVGAALGQKADWIRNIQANPRVQVRVKSQQWCGQAQVITDVKQIADFVQVRLQRHPQMVRAILQSEGVRLPLSRDELERYANKLAVVVITPDQNPPR